MLVLHGLISEYEKLIQQIKSRQFILSVDYFNIIPKH